MADWTAADIPDQTGRVAVITGANTGLGLETARELASAGAHVVLAVRDPARGQGAIDDIRAGVPDADLELLRLDLASLDSIRDAADELGERHPRIDLLINNAGVMYTPYQETADGFELQMGTNHLGHYAWTGRTLDRLLGVDGSRVVTVSSMGHRLTPGIDVGHVKGEGRYQRVIAYGRSKLANLLFTYELQRRLAAADAPTAALAAHPGGSDTELVRHVPFPAITGPGARLVTQSAAMGALPTLRAATDPDAEAGTYYGPDGFLETRGHPVVVRSNRRSRDRDLQRGIWTVSEELTGVTFPV